MTILGQYQSQKSLALAAIDSTKYPDTNKDMAANMRRLNSFVDYLAQYIGQMQKGIDQANQDPIGKVRDLVSGFSILLGGGFIDQIANIDLGDLQYYLPAIGALLGFDATTPFPINLFNAAEHFLLGYIVPLDSFLQAVEDIILSWLTSFGIDEDAIHSIRELLDALVGIGGSIFDFFNTLANLVFDVFGIFGDIGPFGDLWHAVSQLFGGFGIKALGTILDPIFHALAPWIEDLAQFVDFLDQIIKSFTGGILDLGGILNFASLFSSIDFNVFPFNILTTWSQIVAELISPSGIASAIAAFLNGFNPLGALAPDFTKNFSFQPFFGSSNSVAGDGIWQQDDTVVYLGSKSVKTTANGSVRKLIGNQIAVSAGQQVSLSANAQWQGLAGSGSPIRLKIWTDTQGEVTLRSVPSQSFTANDTFANNLLSSNYIIPAGVSKVAMMFVVEATATGGNVWFANAQSNMLPVPSVVESNMTPSGIFGSLSAIFTGDTSLTGIAAPLSYALNLGLQFFNILGGGNSAGSGLGIGTLFNIVQQGIQTTMAIAQNIVFTPINAIISTVKQVIDNLQLWGTYALQMATRFSGTAITAIDGVISGFLSWFNAHN